jgi:hypothetical protein
MDGKPNTMRSVMVAAGVALGVIFNGTANAASTFQGEYEILLTVLAINGNVTLKGNTNLVDLEASAVGNFGTFANATNDRDPLSETILGVGGSVKLTGNVNGATVDGMLLNQASSTVETRGVVAAQNNGTFNATVNFSLDYSLSGSATIDSATRDAALIDILLQAASLTGNFGSVPLTINLPADGLAFSDAKSNVLLLTLFVPAGGSNAVIISGAISGAATTQPVPLPAALPLFAAGVAALGLAARHRANT